MKYADLNCCMKTTAECVVMRHFGVRRDAAKRFLLGFPEHTINEIGSAKRDSDEWYLYLKQIVWGRTPDAEIAEILHGRSDTRG